MGTSCEDCRKEIYLVRYAFSDLGYLGANHTSLLLQPLSSNIGNIGVEFSYRGDVSASLVSNVSQKLPSHSGSGYCHVYGVSGFATNSSIQKNVGGYSGNDASGIQF